MPAAIPNTPGAPIRPRGRPRILTRDRAAQNKAASSKASVYRARERKRQQLLQEQTRAECKCINCDRRVWFFWQLINTPKADASPLFQGNDEAHRRNGLLDVEQDRNGVRTQVGNTTAGIEEPVTPCKNRSTRARQPGAVENSILSMP